MKEEFEVNKDAPAWFRWEIWSMVRKYEFSLSDLSEDQKQSLSVILGLEELVGDGTLNVIFDGINRPKYISSLVSSNVSEEGKNTT